MSNNPRRDALVVQTTINLVRAMAVLGKQEDNSIIEQCNGELEEIVKEYNKERPASRSSSITYAKEYPFEKYIGSVQPTMHERCPGGCGRAVPVYLIDMDYDGWRQVQQVTFTHHCGKTRILDKDVYEVPFP